MQIYLGIASQTSHRDIQEKSSENLFSFNPLHANFFIGNKNVSAMISFLYTDLTNVVEILPQVRQELTYSA